MFKEQTFSSWATISFFLGCERMQKSKTHFPSSLFRVDLSLHSPSSFPFGRESHAEIQKPYSFRKSFVMLENPESPLTHIQNIISVLGGPRHAFAILQSWGKYIFNKGEVATAKRQNRDPHLVARRRTSGVRYSSPFCARSGYVRESSTARR